MTNKKKPDTIVASQLVEEVMAKKEALKNEPKVLRFFSMGLSDDGKPGVYSLELDVANESVVSLGFKTEETRSAAVERFKIAAAGLFRGV